MGTKIIVRNYYTHAPIYSHEREENTLQKTIDCAIEDGVSLDCAAIYGPVKIVGQKIKTAVILDAQLEHCELIGCDIVNGTVEKSLMIRNLLDDCALTECKMALNRYGAHCTLLYCEEVKL